MTEEPEVKEAPRRRFGLFLLPMTVAGLVLGALGWGLMNGSDELPSALIGKPVPEFALPPVKGRALGFSSADLKGDVSLVNVFASWCAPCRIEHPLFVELSRTEQIPIYGINYKDRPDEAEAWLAELGDPYTRTGADLDGRVSIDWGVYGIPETFVVGANGTIAYKRVGPLSRQILDETILPLVEDLRAQAAKGQS